MARATFLKGDGPKQGEQVPRELLARAIAGDHDAFREIFAAEEPHVRYLLFRLLDRRSISEIDDLEQEVFMRVAGTLRSFNGTGSFRSWVSAIVVNVARNHFRRPSVRLQSTRTDDPTASSLVDDAAGAHARVEVRQLLVRLERILERLSPNHRLAITLRIMGHSVDEIASMMSAARSTTRLRLYYARRALRKALGAEAKNA